MRRITWKFIRSRSMALSLGATTGKYLRFDSRLGFRVQTRCSVRSSPFTTRHFRQFHRLGPAQFFDLGRRNLPQIVMDRYEVIDRPPGVRELLLQVSFAALLSHHPSPLLIPVPYSQNTSEVCIWTRFLAQAAPKAPRTARASQFRI